MEWWEKEKYIVYVKTGKEEIVILKMGDQLDYWDY
jgi:hypothetical protein